MTTNAEAISAHIANPYTSVRSDNLFTQDGVLYSYGLHWPLCIWTKNEHGQQVANVNYDRVSSTTTRHRTMLNRELSAQGYQIKPRSIAEMKQLLKDKEAQ